METNLAGESVEPTNPTVTTQDSTPVEQPSPDEQFAGLMTAAVNRMAGTTPPAPEAAPPQEQEPTAPGSEPEPTPKAEQEPEKPVEPETPPVVKLKVNGEEIEVPREKLEALAQQGLDYTRKTQALAERAKQFEAWEAVIGRIQSDPALQARFRALFDDQTPAQPKEKPAPPEDPIERLKWEIREEVLREVESKVKPLEERPAQLERALALQSFKGEIQRDPLYPQAMQFVRQYVEAQPAFARSEIFARLDSDPRAFLEVYGPARDHAASLLEAQRTGQAQQQTNAAPTQPERPATVHRTTTPREAPPLEGAGPAGVAQTETARKAAEMKALTQRIRANKASDSDLVSYLGATGAFRRMGVV